MEQIEKLPIGIKPSTIWKEERLDELYGAVTRFRNQGCRPKIVWLEEIISLEKEFEASAVLSETTKNTGKTK